MAGSTIPDVIAVRSHMPVILPVIAGSDPAEIQHNVVYSATAWRNEKNGKQQYLALSEFRFRLAEFLHFSESAAQAAGITPAQYLLLLHLRGFPGREWGTVGELA